MKTKRMGRPKGSKGRAWVPIKSVPGLIERMHADHLNGMCLRQLGRKYGYEDSNIKKAFEREGLKVVILPKAGCFKRTMHRMTKWELKALAATMTRVAVHPDIKTEWREWKMEKRRWWIRLVRDRLGPKFACPTGPFSENVEFFEYGMPNIEAHQSAMNGGKSSHVAGCKIKVCSQGVIWDGRVWFWSRKAGYVQGVPWTREHGRQLLHVEIWKQATGRDLPVDHVIRYVDGNWNNLDPENLVLASRNDLCRENQAAALAKKSRQKTAALLNLNAGSGDGRILKLKRNSV